MSNKPKSFNLSPELHGYMLAHGTAADSIQQELIDATRALGGISMMQIAPEQGALMTLLARLMGAKRAIEVGTFTGYSALCLARGLPEDGQLICCDVSEEWTKIGVPFWEKAGVRDRIDLRIAPALETLRSIEEDAAFDLAFIDADKFEYVDYFEELLPRMRTDGVILVDNVLAYGKVVDASEDGAMTEAFRRFNRYVARDERVECMILPLADGLTFIRKK